MQSNFRPNSLKTNDGHHNKVTHFFEVPGTHRSGAPSIWAGPDGAAPLRSLLRFGRQGDFGGGDYAQVALLQGADAVAEAGGALEFEILRSFAHLGFELNHGLLQLVLVGDVANRHFVRWNGDVVRFHDSGELHIHGLDDRHRRYVVFAVIGFLLRATAAGFADGLAHGIGHAISVKNRAALDVPRAATHALNQGSGAA